MEIQELINHNDFMEKCLDQATKENDFERVRIIRDALYKIEQQLNEQNYYLCETGNHFINSDEVDTYPFYDQDGSKMDEWACEDCTTFNDDYDEDVD